MMRVREPKRVNVFTVRIRGIRVALGAMLLKEGSYAVRQPHSRAEIGRAHV